MGISSVPLEISGLHEVAEGYDSLICDVWGVVHNGREPFPGAVGALKNFRSARGPVVLLTNAPRLASDVQAQFEQIGVPADCYDSIVTSGEATREELIRRAAGNAPLAVFHLGPERDRAVREGLGLRLTDIGEAELVLCTGLFDDESEGPEDYREVLEALHLRGLVLLCANPDLVVVRGDRSVYCAGAIARAYEGIGGEVVYFGKPYRPVFEYALAKARELGPALRPLVIGDGLETDIRGANTMELDALFVMDGIHGAALDATGPTKAKMQLQELFVRHNARARFALRRFAW